MPQNQHADEVEDLRRKLAVVAAEKLRLSQRLEAQEAEHEEILADAQAAHEAVIAGQRQHLSESEMTALEAREAHEQALLAANEEWRGCARSSRRWRRPRSRQRTSPSS